MFINMLSKSEVMQKARDLATPQHPAGLREMAKDLNGNNQKLFAAIFLQLADTAEEVLAGKDIPIQKLPLGISIEDIVYACPESGAVSNIVYAQRCVRTYAQLRYGWYH